MVENTLTVFVIPAALFTIMVGLGLSLSSRDFRQVLAGPRAVIVGIVGQMVGLPVLGYLIVRIFGLDPVYGLGLMVLALSPGGALSNAIVFLSRADLALSVTLTAIASMMTPLTIPLAYGWLAASFTGESADVALPIGRTLGQLLAISVLPIALGMALKKGFPAFAERVGRPVRIVSVVFFVTVIGGIIQQNRDVLPVGIHVVGPAALALASSSLAVGFLGARWARLGFSQAITIAIELGMQNAATATFVTATLLGNLTMAIPPAIYATVMVPTVLAFGIGSSRLFFRTRARTARVRTGGIDG